MATFWCKLFEILPGEKQSKQLKQQPRDGLYRRCTLWLAILILMQKYMSINCICAFTLQKANVKFMFPYVKMSIFYQISANHTCLWVRLCFLCECWSITIAKHMGWIHIFWVSCMTALQQTPGLLWYPMQYRKVYVAGITIVWTQLARRVFVFFF